MPRFFNTTRSSISFTTRSGAVGVVPPKKWEVIPVEEAASADLVRLVKQGLLVRKEDAPIPVPPAPTPSVVPSPVTVAAPETVVVVPVTVPADVAGASSVEESVAAPVISSRKRRKEAPIVEEEAAVSSTEEAAPEPSIEALETVES